MLGRVSSDWNSIYWWQEQKLAQPPQKTAWQSLPNLSIHSPCTSVIRPWYMPSIGTQYTPKGMCTNVHNTTIHKSPKLETTQMPVSSSRIDEQWETHRHNTQRECNRVMNMNRIPPYFAWNMNESRKRDVHWIKNKQTNKSLLKEYMLDNKWQWK